MTSAIIRARVDAQGLLVAADAPVLRLQQLAGADLGQAIALPQLAQILSVAMKEKRKILRTVTMADDDRLINAVACIWPHGDGADIVLRNWVMLDRTFRTLSVPAQQALAMKLPSPIGWTWETDAELRFMALRTGPSAPPAALDWAGKPLAEILQLTTNPSGEMPIVIARKRGHAFSGQHGTTCGDGMARHDMLLAGKPFFDAAGGLRGFRGTAEPALHMDINQCPHFQRNDSAPVELRFNKRVDDALRSPLNHIIGTAEAIADQVDGPVRPDYARYATDIAQAGRHLLGLVDDLVEVQNIESPNFKVETEPVDLADIARRAVAMASVQAEAKQISLRLLVAPSPQRASGERRRVLQILINLLTNAVRYSPANTEVTLTVERRGDVVQMVVADQGPGISVDHQLLIFEKFERLGRRDGGGSGLGLYIARKLARAMGGDLIVRSDVAHGAIFTLCLPMISGH